MLCMDINIGEVLVCKYVTTLCQEVNTTLRNNVMFDILLVITYVELVNV